MGRSGALPPSFFGALDGVRQVPRNNVLLVGAIALAGALVLPVVASGASVKTCQVLARHSTPSLTIGIYAKASLHDISGEVDALPDPPS